MTIGYKEVVKIVTFDVIETDDDGLVFRLEVVKTNAGFKAQLFRQETYSLKCTFEDFVPDETLFVLDYHTLPDLDDNIFETPESCLNYVAQSLEMKFKR